MTLPNERTRAVNELGDAVAKLYPYVHKGSSETVRVPRALLREIVWWLRHYPTKFDIEMTGRKVPELWENK